MSATVNIALAGGRRPTSGPNNILVRFSKERAGMAGAVALLLIVLTVLLGPLLWQVDPNAQNLAATLQGSSWAHPLGTDAYGRDVLARLLTGGRISLAAAAQAASIALVIGVPLGLISGYAGKVVDTVLGRIVDAVVAIPVMVLVFAIVGVLGPGLTNAMFALGLVMSTEFFRITRSSTLNISSQLFVTASRAVGNSPLRILWKYILPNALGPILVQISFAIAIAITGEAALSFVGVGVQLPQSSWGSMVREGFNSIYESPTMLIPPTIAIIGTILAFSFIGDALNDSFGKKKVAR